MSTLKRTWTRKPLVFPPSNNINPPVIHMGGTGAIMGLTRTTLLRTALGLFIGASVGDPAITSVPPEEWWTRFEASFAVGVNTTGTATISSAYSQDENIVLTGNLYPTLVASPTAPVEYYVTFRIDQNSVESHGERRWDGTGAGLFATCWINFHDYDAAVDAGAYAGISMSAWGYMRNLWLYDV